VTAPVLAWLLLADLATRSARIARRLRALPTLQTPVSAEATPGWRVVTAAGVVLDPATRRAAVEHAGRRGLRALDLVPGDLHTEPALGLFRFVDPRAYHAGHVGKRRHRGLSAGHAVVVADDLAEQAAVTEHSGLDPVRYIEVIMRLHAAAPRATNMALAPGLRAVRYDLSCRKAGLRALKIPVGLALLVQAGEIAALAGAVRSSLGWGLAALAAFWLQPYAIVTGRCPVRPADLHRAVAIRPLWTAWSFLRTLTGRSRLAPTPPTPRARWEGPDVQHP
jgi:hypothetical protein